MSSSLTDRLPLYAQVEDALAARIETGALAPGDQLPSEERLIAEFGVSRTTVRTTIQNLVGRGLVVIRRGRGTFVAEPRIAQELTELTGFVEDMVALGRRPSARVLGTAIVPADPVVALKLGLAVGAPVAQIRRVRLADGVPLSFDETWLPEALGRKIMDDDLVNEQIFTLLETRYATPLIEAEYQLEATTADAAQAIALAIAPGSPVFSIERTSFTTGGRPIDYERLHYRGDRIRFRTRLGRRPHRGGAP